MKHTSAALLQEGPATPHPDYMRMLPLWEQVRDCHEGSKAVKAKRELYLPRPDGMEDRRLRKIINAVTPGSSAKLTRYDKYLLRANFLPAVSRTEEVLSGLLFREEPEVEVPPALAPVVGDATLTGQPLEGFAQDMAHELLVTGRIGVLLDFAEPVSEAVVRPYWSIKAAEEVVSWSTVKAPSGEQTFARVALREDELIPDPDNEYGLATDHRIREYTLEGAAPGQVMVRLWAIREDKWVVIEESTPHIHETPLDRIPLVLANARSIGTPVLPPPLLSISELSLSHYRSSADLEQGNFYASLPTGYVTGGKMPRGDGDSASSDPSIGAGEFLEFPQKEAKVGYLEISGPGLDSIHKTIEAKERQLQAIGARLTTDQRRTQAETASAARLRAESDASMLRLVANVIDQVVTKALSVTATWMGEDGDVSFRLNRSYADSAIEEMREANNNRLDPGAWDLE